MIAGFADLRIRGRGAILKGIGVLRAFEGAGIGGALLERAAEEAHALGFTRLKLIVKLSNRRALSFYQKHGFVFKNRRGEALVLERSLAT